MVYTQLRDFSTMPNLPYPAVQWHTFVLLSFLGSYSTTVKPKSTCMFPGVTQQPSSANLEETPIISDPS